MKYSQIHNVNPQILFFVTIFYPIAFRFQCWYHCISKVSTIFFFFKIVEGANLYTFIGNYCFLNIILHSRVFFSFAGATTSTGSSLAPELSSGFCKFGSKIEPVLKKYIQAQFEYIFSNVKILCIFLLRSKLVNMSCSKLPPYSFEETQNEKNKALEFKVILALHIYILILHFFVFLCEIITISFYVDEHKQNKE